MMPLNRAGIGEEMMIMKVGGTPEEREQLTFLGFAAGESAVVIAMAYGNMIVKLKDGRVGLSEELAKNLTVQKVEGGITRTLKDVPVGQTVTVTKITGKGPVKRRIMDMGITRGTEVFVRKVAPLGDPMEVTVRGYELTLRKEDVEMLQVEG